jgi:hypothetical protein
MNRLAITVFDAFIADGATPTYTSLDHVAGLASGRQIALMVRARKYGGDSYVTVDIEQSVDGKNFQSKYVSYPAGVPPVVTPIVAAHELKIPDVSRPIHSDVFSAAEPYPPMPNLRDSRLAITIVDSFGASKSAYLKVSVCVRGSPDIVRAPASAARRSPPGSLARHGEMISDLSRLSDEARGLDPGRRAAYVLRNMHPDTKAHMQAVDRQYRAMPPDLRTKMMETTRDMMRHAVQHVGRGGPVTAAQQGSCCDEKPVSAPCGECAK